VDIASDDLTKPLGAARGAPQRSLPRLPVARIAGGLLALAAAGVAGVVLVVDDPLGGEPHAVASIAVRPPQAPEAQGPAGVARVQEVPSDSPRRTAAEVESASGVSVVRGDGTAAPSSVVIRVPEPPGPIKLSPAPDPRLVERSRHGVLPRIGPDGARPSAIYARPPGAMADGVRPVGRVAVLVGGLGISQTVTNDAVAKLPPAVTLAFAPYGQDLERLAARAREAGHEIMLQVPMEPFDYPDSDPGPHTLTVKAKPQENLDRLHWVLGRFPGYTGLVNFMGAKLTADEAALAPILREAGARGLLVLDDASSSRSLVAKVGPSVRAAAVRADLVLDAVPRADAIDRELARLEELARSQGLAVGTASALPLTLERIARWTRALESRGILLVPVSSAFEGQGR
jgi:hypothetical protein